MITSGSWSRRAKTTDPVSGEFPPVVYLPCAEHVRDPDQARIAMRNTKDGRVALLAYSALDRLYACCGPDQPWLVTTTTALDELQRVQPFQLLLLDVVVPAGERQEAAS